MDFDDSAQPMFYKTREEFSGANHEEIVDSLVREAAQEGYEPMDFNWNGIPNIYLRGRYSFDVDETGTIKPGTKEWLEDLFVMFVRKKDG